MKFKVGLFDIYIFLITLFKSVEANAGDIEYIFAFAIGCTAIMTKMLHERYSCRELISMLFIVSVGIFNFFIGHTLTIFFTAVTLCGAKKVNTNRVIKIVFWTRLIGFMCMIFASALGIVSNEPLYFWRSDQMLMRYPFGFGHPNIAHTALSVLIFLALYLYWDKINVLFYPVLFLVNCLFYRFTYSRTGFLASTIGIFLFLCMKSSKFRDILVRFARYLYWVFFCLTILMGLLYGKINAIYIIDRLLTGRIQYIHALLTTSLPPLIGRNIYSSYVNFDNGYIIMLYECGLLAFLWISYYMTKAVGLMCKKREYAKLALTICFIIYNMTESFYPSISVNISLLFISDVLFQNQGEKLNEGIDNIHSHI